jgi:molybdate transport system regulatory protein
LISVGTLSNPVELVSLGGDVVSTIITNNTLERLGVKLDSLVTAQVKAPRAIVQTAQAEPVCTAKRLFPRQVSQVIRGKLITEITVRIQDGTELCSVVNEESRAGSI